LAVIEAAVGRLVKLVELNGIQGLKFVEKPKGIVDLHVGPNNILDRNLVL